MTIHHITTNMRGFQRWMREHPRKRTDGYFTFGGKALSHEQVKAIVDYAVKKGYKTDADIPGDEVAKIIGRDKTTYKEIDIDFNEKEDEECSKKV